MTTLSALCDFQEGYVNPAQTHPEFFDGEVKWLRAVDINESFITDTSRTLTKEIEDFTPEESVTFPLGDLASLGAMFSSLPMAFSNVLQATGKGKVLYEAIYSTGVGNKLSIKNGVTYGNIVNGKGTIVDRVLIMIHSLVVVISCFVLTKAKLIEWIESQVNDDGKRRKKSSR